LHPGGRRLRVRGIQVHGAAVERALAGQRTALNLTGAEPSELGRGMVLAEAGRFQSRTEIDCRVDLLPSAKPLKQRAPVHFHAGTAEIEAWIRLLDSTPVLRPGRRAYALFHLREPSLLLPGDRFIIRMFSPVVTIGGGQVVDVSGHRYRRGESAEARLKILAEGAAEERIALLVRESKYGLGIPDLIASTGLLAGEIERAAQFARLHLFRQPNLWVVDREWAEATLKRLAEVLRAFHQQNPLLPGMPKQELRSRELPGAPPFLLDALIGITGGILGEGEMLRLATHKLVLKQDEEQALGAIEELFRRAGLNVPAVSDALAKSGVEPARARSLLQMLLRQGHLVKIGDDLVFHQAALQELRQRLASDKGQRLSVPQFKDLAGVSRKYAIPLLEYLDRERVTRREGDERIVL
jgi:selenocysteine-specific elongation factor